MSHFNYNRQRLTGIRPGRYNSFKPEASLPSTNGIETLIQRASTDEEFKALLFKNREAALKDIVLTETEQKILQSINNLTLLAMIQKNKLNENVRDG